MVDTRSKILQKTTEIFALSGYEGFSMRTLADAISLAPSVLYHYFADKDTLLREMFDTLNTDLGKKRAKLPQSPNAKDMLRQRIIFQLDNAQAIVAVLKYYIAYRKTFPKFKEGFVPDKSSLHIEEVLRFGVETGEFRVQDLEGDAKVITHAINGFLLEYFPYKLNRKEKERLVNVIATFLFRALTKGGEHA